MTQPKIGFIGIGLMGSAMVLRLLDRGYAVTLCANRARPRVDECVAAGAVEAPDARAAAEASDIVMLCVDTSASVEARMRGERGVIAGLAPGATVIDFGTSLPSSTRALGAEVAAAGGVYLDAPLGRTPSHGRQGKLNIMAAGDEGAFARVRPVLEDLGENIFHLGPLGAGHTIKLMNNFFAMTCATAMAEAFATCDKAGVDRQALYDVLSAGPNHSGMMDFVKAYAVDGDPAQLAFSIRNARKDVGYYAQMAEEAGAASLLSPATKTALNLAVAGGRGDDMVPQITELFAALAPGD
ncbi:NAD(P)-dependent oxidoreductase [Rhodovulum sp. DZ06]|uniref:NAD(P)-dependent oxidoreductase n=1 Tax=Rhodovulum sp. DZ06 TaxID=3425126 RepID=UPI003D329E75